MFFVIPVLAVCASAALVKGSADILDSRDHVDTARDRHGVHADELAASREQARSQAQQHDDLRSSARTTVVRPMARWIARHGSAFPDLGATGQCELPGFGGHVPPSDPGLAAAGEQVALGALSAITAAMAAPSAIVSLVGMVGTASTGVAISSLSGAAASSATLATLGGGSLATGGGGIAAGEVLLGAAVPVVGGLVLGAAVLGAGSRARTSAAAFSADVDRDVELMRVEQIMLATMCDRLDEVDDVVRDLGARARRAQSKLFAIRRFDATRDGPVAAIAVELTRAVADLIATPAIDASTMDLSAEMADLMNEWQSR